MQEIAQVIVDVPVMQTNRPFTYRVPDRLQNKLKTGMRVSVPFGQGGRFVQGFIVSLDSETDYDGELKDIKEILDLHPVLSNELVELGEHLAETTYSFQISCYQAMLPNALKAKYQKKVRWLGELDDPLAAQYFPNSKEIDWEVIAENDWEDQFITWQEEDKVEVFTVVKDTGKKKMKEMIQPVTDEELLQEMRDRIRKNATRQLELLAHLETGETLSVNWLRQEAGIPRSVVKNFEERNWVTVKEVEVYRDPYAHAEIEPSSPLKLNDEQQTVYSELSRAVDECQDATYLLEGVTGSGKTEVYLQTIQHALDQGRGALMLVPEIALTPQMVYRFKSRFGDRVAALHSGLSDGEKYDEWRRIERKEADVVVGARSSVFAPLEDIGVIVIDEEHEASYKQADSPRYHARDVAIWRGKHHQCPVILGSATPSLESRARALKDVYHLLRLTKRATSQALPEVSIVDMREEMKAGQGGMFSRALLDRISDVLARKEQAVLMLNRRGFSNFAMCRDCGYVFPCPNCDISLTLHRATSRMKCHYCGYEEPIPKQCPQCGGNHIRFHGSGTQKVEKELAELFPQARILRMDVDTTQRKGAHERILNRFETGQADILLGTQMIAKGLDFPNVTFVGVLNADTGLHLPDFRAAEKTFQLLTQVSGRAGRGDVPGSVIIQTYNPDHYAIRLAERHDYPSFFKQEMHYRHLADYSPYYYLVQIRASHQREQEAARKMNEISHFLKPHLSEEAIILGPSARSIAKINNLYQFQLIIKYKHEPELQQALHELLATTQKDIRKGLRIAIDPNPLSFM